MLWPPVRGERAGTVAADTPGPLAQLVLCNSTYINLRNFLVFLLSMRPFLAKTHHKLILQSLSKPVLWARLAIASAYFVNTHTEAASSFTPQCLTRHPLNTIVHFGRMLLAVTLYLFYVNVKATFGSTHFTSKC